MLALLCRGTPEGHLACPSDWNRGADTCLWPASRWLIWLAKALGESLQAEYIIDL